MIDPSQLLASAACDTIAVTCADNECCDVASCSYKKVAEVASAATRKFTFHTALQTCLESCSVSCRVLRLVEAAWEAVAAAVSSSCW